MMMSRAVHRLDAPAECAAGDSDAGTGGNDAGIETFLHQHQSELLHFFQGRLSQPQDAADLAQEASLRLLRYRHGQSPESLRLLLFRIARNLLNDHWRWTRLHGVEEATDPGELVFESEAPGQDRQVDGQRRLQRLEAVIQGLPPRCRTVFVLSRIQGLSNAQVAKRCGISVKAVEKHLTRALAECRRRVGDPGP